MYYEYYDADNPQNKNADGSVGLAGFYSYQDSETIEDTVANELFEARHNAIYKALQDSLEFLLISHDQGNVHLFRNNVTIIFKPMLKNESLLRIEWRPTVISDEDLISLWDIHEELVDAWSFYGAITEFVNNKIKDFNLRMYGYNE